MPRIFLASLVSCLLIMQAAPMVREASANGVGCGDYHGGFGRPGRSSCVFHCHHGYGVSIWVGSYDDPQTGGPAWTEGESWCRDDAHVRATCQGHETCTGVSPPKAYATKWQPATCKASVEENWPSDWEFWCSNEIRHKEKAQPKTATNSGGESTSSTTARPVLVKGFYVGGSPRAELCVGELGGWACVSTPIECTREAGRLTCII